MVEAKVILNNESLFYRYKGITNVRDYEADKNSVQRQTNRDKIKKRKVLVTSSKIDDYSVLKILIEGHKMMKAWCLYSNMKVK